MAAAADDGPRAAAEEEEALEEEALEEEGPRDAVEVGAGTSRSAERSELRSTKSEPSEQPAAR